MKTKTNAIRRWDEVKPRPQYSGRGSTSPEQPAVNGQRLTVNRFIPIRSWDEVAPRPQYSGRGSTSPERRVLRYCLLLLVLAIGTATGLFAQNGVTLSNFKARVAGDRSAATLTIDLRWTPPLGGKLWSDTVWVFVDYNHAGTMTRLPLAPGATLTNPSWSGASVIEVENNPHGVWVAGNARTSINPQSAFSATVQMVTSCGEARPCIPTGACVYAINYPPVGRYDLSGTVITFRGTPPFELTFRDGHTGVLERQAAPHTYTYTVQGREYLSSFSDASRAPGTIGEPPCFSLKVGGAIAGVGKDAPACARAGGAIAGVGQATPQCNAAGGRITGLMYETI